MVPTRGSAHDKRQCVLLYDRFTSEEKSLDSQKHSLDLKKYLDLKFLRSVLLKTIYLCILSPKDLRTIC